MLSSAQTIEQFNKYVIGNYTRYPVCLTHGEGSLVWDATSNGPANSCGRPPIKRQVDLPLATE